MSSNETQQCSFIYSSDGELIVQYPDGTQDATGLHPNIFEKRILEAFIGTTTGLSLLMRMRRMLLFDDRTGLLTAKAGQAHIEKALEHINDIVFSGVISVVFIDLDHFGKVNKEHGQATGDRVLEWFAHILKKKTRSSDIVIRWGGEEFVIFSTHGTPPAERTSRTRDRDGARKNTAEENHGQLLAQRIKTALEASPVHISGTIIEQRATFGTASMVVTPNDNVERVFDRLFLAAERLTGKAKLSNQRGLIHAAPTMYANA